MKLLSLTENMKSMPNDHDMTELKIENEELKTELEMVKMELNALKNPLKKIDAKNNSFGRTDREKPKQQIAQDNYNDGRTPRTKDKLKSGDES